MSNLTHKQILTDIASGKTVNMERAMEAFQSANVTCEIKGRRLSVKTPNGFTVKINGTPHQSCGHLINTRTSDSLRDIAKNSINTLEA